MEHEHSSLRPARRSSRSAARRRSANVRRPGLVCPRVKRVEPCTRGRRPVSIVIGRTVSRSARRLVRRSRAPRSHGPVLDLVELAAMSFSASGKLLEERRERFVATSLIASPGALFLC